MENYELLFLGFGILVLFFIVGVLFKKKFKMQKSTFLAYQTDSQFSLTKNIKNKETDTDIDTDTLSHDDLLVISVMAKPGHFFESYDLLNVLSSAGLQFGEMNIFHYYSDGEILFSLVSAEKPGDFDLEKMGEFSCSGLMLFMKLKSGKNLQESFDLMLLTAEHLAEDLEGELYANPKTPWSDAITRQYYSKLEQVQIAG